MLSSTSSCYVVCSIFLVCEVCERVFHAKCEDFDIGDLLEYNHKAKVLCSSCANAYGQP